MKGKRGPRKGDGGRPKTQLTTDKDRFAVALAHWLTKQGESPSPATLKFADMLASENDVEIERGGGVAGRRRVTLGNIAGDDLSSEEVWRRRPLAPGGGQQWRGRIAVIGRKASRAYCADDAVWLAQSFYGLDSLVSPDASDQKNGSLALHCLRWPRVIVVRLAQYFRRRVIQHGATPVGNRVLIWTSDSNDPSAVLFVEDFYKIDRHK